MEYKTGTFVPLGGKFNHNGQLYEVVKPLKYLQLMPTCVGCAFYIVDDELCNTTDYECMKVSRQDGLDVIFKKL